MGSRGRRGAATLDIKNFNIPARRPPGGGKHIMYSADVPAILSARKTYSFSVESNPAHAPSRLPTPYRSDPPALRSQRPHFSIRDDDARQPSISPRGLFLSFFVPLAARSLARRARAERKFLCLVSLACPASLACSLILMLVSFVRGASFFLVLFAWFSSVHVVSRLCSCGFRLIFFFG